MSEAFKLELCPGPRRSTPISRIESLVYKASRRAKHRGQRFEITGRDLLPAPDVCPALGIPLRYDGKGQRGNWATIDKIVPALGYIPGNVQIISWRANRLKGDGSPRELLAIVNYITQRIKASEVL